MIKMCEDCEVMYNEDEIVEDPDGFYTCIYCLQKESES